LDGSGHDLIALITGRRANRKGNWQLPAMRPMIFVLGDATFGCLDKFDDPAHFRRAIHLFFDLDNGIATIEAGIKKDLKCTTQRQLHLRSNLARFKPTIFTPRKTADYRRQSKTRTSWTTLEQPPMIDKNQYAQIDGPAQAA